MIQQYRFESIDKKSVIDFIETLPNGQYDTSIAVRPYDYFKGFGELRVPCIPSGTKIKRVNLPDKVIFNKDKKATTLLTNSQNNAKDVNVTVVKSTKGDKFDKEKGFLLAYFQQHSGLSKTQANKYMKNLLKEE